MAKDHEEIWQDFGDLVNMAPKELEEWLATDESKSVGDSDDGESTGHESGRKIVEIKRTKKADNSTTYNEYIRHGNTGKRKTLRVATIA